MNKKRTVFQLGLIVMISGVALSFSWGQLVNSGPIKFSSKSVDAPAPGPISVIDARHVWVGLSYTSDGGASWIYRLPPTDSHEFEQAIPPNEHAFHYESTYFVTTSRGWLKGLERLWLTNDAGLTWSPVRGDISFPIGFYGRKGWAAGRSPGGVTNLVTDDLGKTWTGCGVPWTASDGLPTGSPFFWDARTGWITVATYDELHRPADQGIAKTEDGGCTWRVLWRDPAPDERLLTARFVDKSFGWIGGIRGRLLETRDGGLHWRGILLPGPEFYLDDFYLLDRNRGWVLGNFQSTFYYTLDAGKHWQVIGKSDLMADQGAARSIPAAWGAGLLAKMRAVHHY